MVMTTEEFVSAFHALDGLTIAERKKNLFRLLNDNVDAKIDYEEIRPLTELEETFKADVVIFFRAKDEMLKLITNENLAVIEKVLKENWFVKHLCKNVSGKTLVSDIFPNISYNAKQKLLNKLALNIEDPSKGDELFYCVKESYGQYLASKLLPCCGQDLILHTLQTCKVELTPRQLLLAIKKNPSITSSIIENIIKSHPNVNAALKYSHVFRHLMVNDPSILIEVDDHQFKLGKRATRHFLLSNPEFFLKHSQKLNKLLNRDEIGRSLPNEISAIFSRVVPKSMTEFERNFDDYLALLDVLPTDRDKLDILLSTFNSCYGGDLLAQPGFLVPKVFQWMSADFRKDWLQRHSKPSELSQERWISYMDSDQSITLLKQKLACTSNINDREKLIQELVLTCSVNKDLDGLADVCDYVLSKHRNDHSKVRIAFLRKLHECFKLNKLKEEHWKHLKQFIHTFDFNYVTHYYVQKFIVAFVYFSLKKDLPITDPLKKYAQISYGRYNILQYKQEYEKRCLETFYDVIPSCFSNEDLKYHYTEFLVCICNWNKRHANDTMSVFSFEKAVTVLMSVLEERDYFSNADVVVISCILNEYEKAKEMNLLKLLLSRSRYTEQIIRVINRRSVSLIDDLESFLQIIFKSYLPLCALQRCFRNVLDSKTRQQIAAHCKKAVNEDLETLKKSYPFYVLSLVSTREDFINFVRQFYPTESVVNLEDPMYKLRQEIPTTFLRFVRPSEALGPILHFCVGDYMQFAQRSLHRLVYGSPEFEVAKFLKKLAQGAVSVRKHSVYLSLLLLNSATNKTVLSEWMNNEKNASIRKTLFQSVLNSFLRSYDASLWKVVEENMKTFNVDDDIEPVKMLIARLKKVPNQFYSTYVQFTWKSLDKVTVTDTIVENKRSILAEITKEYVGMLPTDFCTNVIKAHLYSCNDTEFLEKIYSFAANHIMRHGNNVSEIFHVINTHLASHPKASYKLIKELCDNFIENKFANESVFVSFVSLWNSAVKPFEALPEHLYLNLTLVLCRSCKHLSVVEIGKEISALFHSLHEEKVECVNEFVKCFECVFNNHSLSHLFGSKEVNLLGIIDNIINAENCYICLCLGLSLLPYEIKTVPKIREIYERITKKAAACSDLSVQVALRSHLINKE